MNRSNDTVQPQKSLAERFLSLFTEVRSGEGVVALLMTLNIFLILTSYLIAKVVREPLILAGGGAEVKSYSAALQAVVLVVALRVYTMLVARFDRRRLINSVTIFFAACFVLFYGLARAEVPIGVVYYVWVGIFSLMVIAQFWAFANDAYTPERGKRLFIVIQFGASAGGVFGPMLARLLLEFFHIHTLLLFSAGILLASLVITGYLDRILVRTPAPAAPGKESVPVVTPVEEKISSKGAFGVVFRSRYLLMIALIVLFTNWVNTTGEYMLGKAVTNASHEAVVVEGLGADEQTDFVRAYIGKFYSEFFLYVGLAGLLAQLFVVSLVIKFLGVRIAIVILPIVALGGYAVFLLFPVLGVIRWPKMVENATDYSLNNTVRHILFLPTTTEEKYKAKVAIDSFFVRAGDVLSALVVFVGVNYLSFGIREFAVFNMILVGVWFAIGYKTGTENQRLVAQRSGAV